MEELQGIFIGYKSFKSSKNNKDYFVISLLFVSLDEINARANYFVKDVFVAVDTYNSFIKNHSLLSTVDVRREIVGDSVRYYI